MAVTESIFASTGCFEATPRPAQSRKPPNGRSLGRVGRRTTVFRTRRKAKQRERDGKEESLALRALAATLSRAHAGDRRHRQGTEREGKHRSLRSREQNGVPTVTICDLLQATRPHRADRIILGEIRGGVAFDPTRPSQPTAEWNTIHSPRVRLFA